MLSHGNGSDEILSGGKIATDALASFTGAFFGHIAGEFIHVPDDPITSDVGITGAAASYPETWADIESASLRQQSISVLPSSISFHTTSLLMGLWPSGNNNAIVPNGSTLGWDEFDGLNLLMKQDCARTETYERVGGYGGSFPIWSPVGMSGCQ